MVRITEEMARMYNLPESAIGTKIEVQIERAGGKIVCDECNLEAPVLDVVVIASPIVCSNCGSQASYKFGQRTGVTYVSTEIDGTVYSGKSVCKHGDVYNKKQGMMRAFQRIVQQYHASKA